MWFNPDSPNIFIETNDGGANITQDSGKSWSTQMNQPTAELLFHEADQSMYRVKRTGGEGVAVAGDSDDEPTSALGTNQTTEGHLGKVGA